MASTRNEQSEERPGTAGRGIVVAVDGPSGSGKSSTARGVARRLGLRYLDTGAMYRAVAWWLLRAGVDLDDPAAIEARAREPKVEIQTDPDQPTVTVDGTDVSGPIRSREVTNAVSRVAAVPAVRAHLVVMQREIVGDGGIVVEGRDIGTTVVPDADVKIFLTADPDERARRRSAEGLAGVKVDVGVARQEMASRDQRDSSRAASPLAQAPDAVALDTTAMSLDEVIDAIVALADKHA